MDNLSIFKRSSPINQEIPTIQLDNSEFPNKKSTNFFVSSYNLISKPSIENKTMSAKNHYSNYICIREMIIYVLLLTFIFCIINFTLNYPPNDSDYPSTVISMCFSVLLHFILLLLNFLLISNYAHMLLCLEMSKSFSVNKYIIRKVIFVSVPLICFPFPKITGSSNFVLEKYFQLSGPIINYKSDLNKYLFMIEAIISFLFLMYFFCESRTKLDIRSLRVRNFFGIRPNYREVFKSSVKNIPFLSLILFFYCGVFLFATLIMFSETGLSYYMEATGDHSSTFQTNDINKSLLFSGYSNAIWYSMMTLAGFSPPELSIFSGLTKLTLYLGTWFGFFMFALSLYITASNLKLFTKKIQKNNRKSDVLSQKLLKEAAANFIKTFFMKFLLYRRSNSVSKLLNIENKLVVMCLTFRRIKNQINLERQASHSFDTFEDLKMIQENAFLIDRMLKYIATKKRTNVSSEGYKK